MLRKFIEHLTPGENEMRTLMMVLVLSCVAIADSPDCTPLATARDLAWFVEIDAKVEYLQVYDNWQEQMDAITEFAITAEAAGWGWLMQPIIDNMEYQADQYFANVVTPAFDQWQDKIEAHAVAQAALDDCYAEQQEGNP